MSERGEIIEGMAHRLWTHAAGLRPRDVGYRDVPAGARKAAEDLASLYENLNETGLRAPPVGVSLQAMRWEHSPGEDTHAYGSWLARAALEPTVPDDLSRRQRRRSARYEAESNGMMVPLFSITMRGDELEWEGGAQEMGDTREGAPTWRARVR